MSQAAVLQINDLRPRSPQVEDGFTRIANELIDAMSAADLTENEQRVLYRVIRRTYGFNKKQDDIAASQIGMECRMASSHVTAALNSLARKHFIHKRPGTYGCIIGVQKDWSRWPMRSVPSEFVDGPKKRRGRPSKDDVITEPMPEDVAEKTPTESVVVYLVDAEKPLPILEKPLRNPSQTPTESVYTKDNSKDKGQKNKTLSAATLPDGFAAFWSVYPRGEKKKAAAEAWQKLGPDAELQATILASIKDHEKTDQWKRGIYPHAVTFLKEKRWKDDLRVAYTDAELTVVRNYNEMIGARIDIYVDEDHYDEKSARQIRMWLKEADEVVGHPDRGEYSARYFSHVLKHCAPDKLKFMRLEWLMDNLSKALGRDFSR